MKQLASLARWLWRLVRRVFTRRPRAPIISGTTYPWEKATRIYFAGESLTITRTTYPWEKATRIYFTGERLTITGTTYPWEKANEIKFKSNTKGDTRHE